MPLYDFICEDCKHIFDNIQKYEDESPKCVKCNGSTSRVVGAPSFVLKGSGWYKDGYSNKPQEKKKK